MGIKNNNSTIVQRCDAVKCAVAFILLVGVAFGEDSINKWNDFRWVQERAFKEKVWKGPFKIVSITQNGGETSFEITEDGSKKTVYVFPTVIRSGDFGNSLEVQRLFDLLLLAFEKKKEVLIMSGICHVGGPEPEEYRTEDCCFAVKISQ